MADSLAVQAVDAISDLAGTHQGQRAAHAKGTLLSATFTATPAAARLTRAAHMRGEPVRATSAVLERRRRSRRAGLRGGGARDGGEALPGGRVEDGHGRADAAVLLRPHAGGLRRVHADPQATVTYNGIHSFLWLDADGGERWIRYSWEPEDGERVEVGRLELGGPEEGRERGDDVLVFDPMRLTNGIEASDDRILRFRPRAYAVSVERRSGAPIPAGLA